MYALTFVNIAASHVEYLRNKYHIYMLRSGRINICGLNTNNLSYVAEAITDTLLNVAK